MRNPPLPMLNEQPKDEDFVTPAAASSPPVEEVEHWVVHGKLAGVRTMRTLCGADFRYPLKGTDHLPEHVTCRACIGAAIAAPPPELPHDVEIDGLIERLLICAHGQALPESVNRVCRKAATALQSKDAEILALRSELEANYSTLARCQKAMTAALLSLSASRGVGAEAWPAIDKLSAALSDTEGEG
jgi:hypothetical protein